MHQHTASAKPVESGSGQAEPSAHAFGSASQVTLLFTDIEGSTALWEEDEARMSQALALHDALARNAVESHGGDMVKTTGDGILAVFDDASAALAATLELQRALHDPAVSGGAPLRVRCGLHRGIVEHRDGDYFGSTVNRAARIMSAAHGGQVLLSQAVADSVRDRLPAQVSLRDLGRIRLRDLSTPECVYQAVHPQLRVEFPALRSLETTPNNLPLQPTTFIGRDKELAELKRLFATARLLTLTGAGGCGKTRLGLQLAADSLDRFPDGAWLVELAPLSDPGLVPRTAAMVLGLEERTGESDHGDARRASQGQAAPAAARQLRAPARRVRGACRFPRAAMPASHDPGEQSGSARHRRRADLSRAVAIAARSQGDPYAGLDRSIRGLAAFRRSLP